MSDSKNAHQYDDIINLPHHQSKRRKHMPISDRAAQFAPFAALTGYSEAVEETARITDDKIDLDEDRAVILNNKLKQLQNMTGGERQAAITYFVPDEKKNGGRYFTISGSVKKVDGVKKIVIMSDNTVISFDNILDISGDWLEDAWDEQA